MSRKTYFLMIVLVVVVLSLTLSVSAVLAGNSRELPPPQHAPVCYIVPYFAPGISELQCYDAGKDIMGVQVATKLKYDLEWNNETVTLRVYSDLVRDISTYWVVLDKAGNKTSGYLP
jgi:hypothetical protein